MKLKKILALVCSLAISTSVMVSSVIVADAAEGCEIALEFTGYETKGATTFAVVNVNLTVPETLSPYQMIPADWETTFEDTYSGFTLQGMGIDIPKVDGLTYVSSLSTINEPVAATDASALKLSYAATGAYDTYYGENISKTLATLYYRITGDVSATYDLTVTDCVVGYAIWDGSSNSKPTTKEYTYGDFKVTGCTIKPETSATIDSITIDPTEATVEGGATQTFSVVVEGTGDYDNTYTLTATAGSFDGDVFTAPEATEEEQVITITATANGDNSKTATATVTVPAKEVTPPDPEKEATKVEFGTEGKAIFFDSAAKTYTLGVDAYINIKSAADGVTKKFGHQYFLNDGIEGEGAITATFGVVADAKYADGNFSFEIINN